MEQVDIQAQNLAKAIKQEETGSGDTYNTKGKSGEFGAYQFMPDTYKSYAKRYLGDENAQPSVENQNKIAYSFVKDKKDQGFTPAQIASMWNAGEGKPDAYKQNFRGVNDKGVQYDTPQYVKNVSAHYQAFSGAQPTQQPVQQPQKTNTQTLNEDINKRGEQIGTGVESLLGGKAKTGQTRASGLLQTAGGAAGALGDVVSAGLRVIPGVKQLESVIGSGVGKLAQTESGQAILKSMQDFSEKHPELAKDTGAAFDIVTAIPILKGLGALKNIGYDAASTALKDSAEKTLTQEATRIVGKTQSGANFLSRNPGAVESMVQERILPEINGNAFDSQAARKDVVDQIKKANKEVGKILENDTETRVANENATILNNVINGYTDRLGRQIQGFPNSKLTPDEILNIAEDLTPKNAKLWDKFKAGEASVKEINTLRSELDSAVKNVYTSLNKPPITKEVGATLAGAMRDFVQTFKPETRELFAKMTRLNDTDKVLSLLHGKEVRPASIFGTVRNVTKDVPVASYVGEKIAQKGPKITLGVLKRTGKNAAKTTKKSLGKLPGLFAGMINK